MNIGNKISNKRKELGMTQQELADKLFVSVKTVSKWETNRGNPEMNILPSIAKVLDINIADLFDEGEDIEKDNYQPEKAIDIINVCFEYGTFVLGFVFFFLTFFTFKTSLLNSDFPISDFFGSNSITYNFSGYDVLFKMNGTNFLGVIWVLGIWLTYIFLFVHIALGTIELVVKKKDILDKKNRLSFLLSIVEMVVLVISFIIGILSAESLGFGIIMMVILYLVVLGYNIYLKKKKQFN